MRLHDECWWKCGQSQRLCGNDMYPWALKPSHNVMACVLSNHVKLWRIHAKVEGISMLVPFTTQHATSKDNGIGDGLVNWKVSHDISREFQQWLCWWEWRMMTMRLHDEHWWKCGRSQRLCKNGMHPWALKPSHTMKACDLSNHVKFRCIQAQIDGIWMLAPFTT